MDTRTRLLDAAEAAVRARGLNGFSYADLASEVGLRKASIHYHFPTKADLIKNVLQTYVTRFQERLADLFGQEGTGAEQLRAYLNEYRLALKEGEALCLCVALSADREALNGPAATLLENFHSDSVAVLQRAFKLGQQDQTIFGVTDPRAEALGTLALVEGAQLIARASKDITLFDQATLCLASRLEGPEG